MWLGIGDAVEHWARYKPNKTAISIGGFKYTFAALYERACEVGTYVLSERMQGRVAVGIEDQFEYIAALAGLNKAGFSIVILNPRPKPDALAIHLDDSQPALVIGSHWLSDVVADVGKKFRMEVIDKIAPVEKPFPMTPHNNEEWGLVFSSGSTGISKAIVYDHQSMTSELLAWCLELGVRRETTFYIGRPIFYTGGLVLTLATLLVGGEVILPRYQEQDDFDAIWSDYQKCASTASIDFAFFIPDQIRRFVRLAAKKPKAAKIILVMGSRISGDDKLKAHKALISNIVESWGNSEGLGTITDIEDLQNRPNSIGRPFLTEKLFVVTDELHKCKPKAHGRLAGSEETMFVKYANRPDATERVKKNNLILSDDIGYMEDDGYFYLLGRDQESFVVKGKTIFLADLDDIARTVHGVSDAVVVCVPNVDSQVFCALAITRNKDDQKTIEKKLRDKLPIPLESIFFVDDLPRLPSGKVSRIDASRLAASSR